jgi:hypothetical protein
LLVQSSEVLEMNQFCKAVLWLAAGMLLLVMGRADTEASPPPVVTRFVGLFDRLRAAQIQAAAGTPEHISFQLTEAEINEYMRYTLRATPRPGLNSVTVKLFPHNYVSTFTVVDFDAVERWRPGTIPAPLRLVLNGRKSVWVDCRFQADHSRMTFSVEKAYYQDLRLPAFFVEKMIQIVAARQPEKYDTSKPLSIPFGLRQIWTAEHVIQGEN